MLIARNERRNELYEALEGRLYFLLARFVKILPPHVAARFHLPVSLGLRLDVTGRLLETFVSVRSHKSLFRRHRFWYCDDAYHP